MKIILKISSAAAPGSCLVLCGVLLVAAPAGAGDRTALPAVSSTRIVPMPQTPPLPAERAELVMGTVARVAVLAGDRTPATFEAAFGALRRVDASMSLYRPESDLVRVNAHAAARAEPVPPELFDVLTRARDISGATEGAFDVTVLPLLRAWGAYPELSDLTGLNPAAVGFEGMQLDASTRTVRFRLPGMAVDLGGIAKGFALDRARDALAAHGVQSARLDLGGNLVFLGDGPERDWRIAVRDPRMPGRALGTLVLRPGSAVATTGNYARDFATEGWRVPSHVYDPRTRRPVLTHGAVTVWAPDGVTADALSTAFFVLGPEEATPVLARLPDVGVLFVDADGPREHVIVRGAPPVDWRAAAHDET